MVLTSLVLHGGSTNPCGDETDESGVVKVACEKICVRCSCSSWPVHLGNELWVVGSSQLGVICKQL